MNSIDFESLIVTVFVLVDDWYQTEGKTLKALSPGAKAEMSDSEIITLAWRMTTIRELKGHIDLKALS